MLNVFMLRPYIDDVGAEFTAMMLPEEWLTKFPELSAYPEESGFQAIEDKGYFFIVYPDGRMKDAYKYLKKFYLASSTIKPQLDEVSYENPEDFWDNHIYGFDNELWSHIHGGKYEL